MGPITTADRRNRGRPLLAYPPNGNPHNLHPDPVTAVDIATVRDHGFPTELGGGQLLYGRRAGSSARTMGILWTYAVHRTDGLFNQLFFPVFFLTMAKQLLIVESPNKKQKLLQYLELIDGPDSWYVAASIGHVQDLPDTELGIDRANKYSMDYRINPDKQKVVSELKRLTAMVGPQHVVLATDPDREGETIAWHLCRLLGDFPR